ncbi:microtubule associated protein-domain-containing protein [Haematococcus lacustris]
MDCAGITRAALVSYEEICRVCTAKLARIFEDLCLPDEEQAEELHRICSSAENLWTQAVKYSEQRREQLQAKISEALSEVNHIQAQLGTQEIIPAASPRGTLKDVYEHSMKVLMSWRDRKAARQHEFEELLTTNQALEKQLGLPSTPCVPDLTQESMDYLQLQHERLQSDKDRRLQRALEAVARLRSACAELGEDEVRAAAEVHPSLKPLAAAAATAAAAAAAAAGSLAYSAESPGQPRASLGQSSALSDISSMSVDLSNQTFARLAEKQEQLAKLKADREVKMQALADVLCSLWEAVGVAPTAPERAAFESLLAVPSRLHAHSLEQVQAEVRRLEDCRAQAMRDLTLAKAKELHAVCSASHLPAPNLSELLAELSRTSDKASDNSPGKISECLARMVRSLAHATAEARRRQPLVDAMAELQGARREASWLREYEADANRFKGRDANTKLQRSIRAQRSREVLPSLVVRLQQLLEEWRLKEGSPFMFDDQDALVLLADIQAEVQVDADSGRLATRPHRPASAAGPPALTHSQSMGHAQRPSSAAGPAPSTSSISSGHSIAVSSASTVKATASTRPPTATPTSRSFPAAKTQSQISGVTPGTQPKALEDLLDAPGFLARGASVNLGDMSAPGPRRLSYSAGVCQSMQFSKGQLVAESGGADGAATVASLGLGQATPNSQGPASRRSSLAGTGPATARLHGLLCSSSTNLRSLTAGLPRCAVTASPAIKGKKSKPQLLGSPRRSGIPGSKTNPSSPSSRTQRSSAGGAKPALTQPAALTAPLRQSFVQQTRSDSAVEQAESGDAANDCCAALDATPNSASPTSSPLVTKLSAKGPAIQAITITLLDDSPTQQNDAQDQSKLVKLASAVAGCTPHKSRIPRIVF